MFPPAIRWSYLPPISCGSTWARGTLVPLSPIFFSVSCSLRQTLCQTRMHSSRMRAARSLTVSCRIPCMSPPPCMPPTTMHAPRNHACPLQPCMPPRSTHPLGSTHTPQKHAHPPGSTHTPEKHTCLPRNTHTPVNILPCPKLRLRAVIICSRFPVNPGSATAHVTHITHLMLDQTHSVAFCHLACAQACASLSHWSTSVPLRMCLGCYPPLQGNGRTPQSNGSECCFPL